MTRNLVLRTTSRCEPSEASQAAGGMEPRTIRRQDSESDTWLAMPRVYLVDS